MKSKRRRPLTREEWQAIAGQFRHATHLLQEIDGILSETITVAKMQTFRRAFGKVQSLRSRLDSVRSFQHRDWPEGDKLFFGPQWTYHAEWR
jgi:hypothetical protein